MTPAEQHKAHIRRYFQEIVSKGNLEAIPDFVAPNIVFKGPYTPQPIRGIAGFRELIAMLYAAFSDLQVTEEDMVVEGDTVAMRWTVSGTHRGEFMETGPSGEPFRFTWWPPIVSTVGEAKVIDHYINEELTTVCTAAVISTVNPPATLRVVDRFTVSAEGKIIEQENHFDPRDVTNLGWQKG